MYYVKDLEAGDMQALQVDAGEMFFSTRVRKNNISEQDRKTALALAQSMSHIGIDAINIGARDLINGLEFIRSLQKSSADSSALPFISSNLVDAESGKPIFERYRVVNIAGLKIGIFGVADQAVQAYTTDARVTDPVTSATAVVSELKDKCDMIVGLINLARVKAIELAREVEGIDIIVIGSKGGATREPISAGDSILVQAGDRGRSIGVMEVSKTLGIKITMTLEEKQNLKIELKRLEAQKSILSGPVEKDPEASSMAKELATRIEQIKGELQAASGGLEHKNKIVSVEKSMQEDPKVAEWAQQAQPRTGYTPPKPEQEPKKP